MSKHSSTFSLESIPCQDGRPRTKCKNGRLCFTQLTPSSKFPQEDRIMETMHGQTAPQICTGKWICNTRERGAMGMYHLNLLQGSWWFMVQVYPLDSPACLENTATAYLRLLQNNDFEQREFMRPILIGQTPPPSDFGSRTSAGLVKTLFEWHCSFHLSFHRCQTTRQSEGCCSVA